MTSRPPNTCAHPSTTSVYIQGYDEWKPQRLHIIMISVAAVAENILTDHNHGVEFSLYEVQPEAVTE